MHNGLRAILRCRIRVHTSYKCCGTFTARLGTPAARCAQQVISVYTYRNFLCTCMASHGLQHQQRRCWQKQLCMRQHPCW